LPHLPYAVTASAGSKDSEVRKGDGEVICGQDVTTFYAPDEWNFAILINPPEARVTLPRLYDMRVVYAESNTDWYGPYALTDQDIVELNRERMQGSSVDIREHQCDEPVNGGCGHIREGLPAPY
jgi:hypothetical protein